MPLLKLILLAINQTKIPEIKDIITNVRVIEFIP
jgi:hypothetical protein